MAWPTSEFIFLFSKTYYTYLVLQVNASCFTGTWNWLYSQTCIKTTPLWQRNSGLIRQLTSLKGFNLYEIFCDMTIKQWPFDTDDCLIEVTVWVGLTVYDSLITNRWSSRYVSLHFNYFQYCRWPINIEGSWWSWSYDTWINNYLCLSSLKWWVQSRWWRSVLDSTLCDKVCQWLPAGRWFSPDTLVSFTTKIDRHDTTEILLKVALSTIILILTHKDYTISVLL